MNSGGRCSPDLHGRLRRPPRAPNALTDRKKVEVRVREVMMRIETELAADVERARRILSEKLGNITVEERDNGVYAQMDIGSRTT